MQFAMQLSISDFSQGWGKSERTWGEPGVKSLIDSVYDTGIRTLFWRTTCSGPLNYPSKVKFADAYFSEQLGEAMAVDFRNWDSLRIAVDYAHHKGMAIWAWYDQTDSHGGCGGASKHNQFILQHPDLTRKPRRGGLPSEVEVQEHRDPNCPLIGRGTQGSLSYKEVQDFRLSIIRENVEYGMDGIYIVGGGSIGYEEPVVETFMKKYDLDPNELPEDDSRWASHQGEVLTGYLRRVRDVLESSGRRIELVFESRGPRKSLPGLCPYVASQVKTLINGKVLDYLSVWVCEDVLTIKKLLGGDPSHIIRRFELSSDAEKWWLFEGASAMKDLGISIFSVDEATNVEPDHWELIAEMVDRYGD